MNRWIVAEPLTEISRPPTCLRSISYIASSASRGSLNSMNPKPLRRLQSIHMHFEQVKDMKTLQRLKPFVLVAGMIFSIAELLG